MRKPVATVIIAAALGAALAGPAAAAPADAEECVAYAVAEEDAGYLLADLACSAATLMQCYRLFRAEYGPQLWALTACSMR
ncbi:hypothetical protein N8J89_35025 [Crossiella sp. CA-258035]|uniref:hypothetical protein n=1 Tax=Crossiella sp. CA-258035 TaxID=2981138 RepID=UPI0024BC04BE|nr:hypothetical protein [Crossiella sp. CA-258035]WHT18271.1 hypothetical protein N8J89_35025 [Crossiella sp. CA-258035]